MGISFFFFFPHIDYPPEPFVKRHFQKYKLLRIDLRDYSVLTWNFNKNVSKTFNCFTLEFPVLIHSLPQENFFLRKKWIFITITIIAVHFSLYYPPVDRPGLGCRELVVRNLGKLVPAISNDLTDWLVATRVRTSQLLSVLLLHSEEHSTQHVQPLLATLYRACTDTEKDVIRNVSAYFVRSWSYHTVSSLLYSFDIVILYLELFFL